MHCCESLPHQLKSFSWQNEDNGSDGREGIITSASQLERKNFLFPLHKITAVYGLREILPLQKLDSDWQMKAKSQLHICRSKISLII